MAPREGRLIDAQVTGRNRLAAPQTTADGARLNARRFVPAQPQAFGHRRDRRVLHPVDGQRLEQRREAGAFLGPRDAHLANAMRGTVQARHAGMHEGAVLAGVEVPPFALAMIVSFRQGWRVQRKAVRPMR
jgi:hypothetical protein